MNLATPRFPDFRLTISRWMTLSAAMLFLSSATSNANNVLLIIADDLGADSVGLFSTAVSTAPTPNLDALAANGVRFTRCWANPICSPARASLLTGRHGFRTGVGAPGDGIDLSEGTIADAFVNAGHKTACIGKWHLSNNGNGAADNPNLMGFEHYSGSLRGAVANYFSWSKVINGQTQQPEETTYATTENVNDAIDWIDDQGSDDWFLWLAFNAPHTPFHLPPDHLHSYNLTGSATDIAANPTPYYQASVEAIDTEIGRLLSAIDPAVLATTTVIFVGDNGTPRTVSPRVVRGAKDQLWEGGVNVPCIVSGPAVQGDLNRTNDAQIHFVDFFKTMLDIAEVDVDAHTPAGAATDSKSFAGYLFDANLPSVHLCQYTTKFADPVSANDGDAIANDQFKLIRYSGGNEEFYDRSNERLNLLETGLDPNQSDNYAGLVNKLVALLEPPKVMAIVRDNDSLVRPDLLNQVEDVFNQNVSVVATDLVLRDDSSSQSVDLAASNFSYDASTFTATWDFGALPTPLSPAFYSFDLTAGNIAAVDDGETLDGDDDGVSGPDFVQSLYVAIPGDANLSGNVDVLEDALTLVNNLGVLSGATWLQGDFNGDGSVDVLSDAFIVVQQLGQNVQP